MRLRENSLKIKRDKNNKDGNEWKHQQGKLSDFLKEIHGKDYQMIQKAVLQTIN